MTNVIKSPPVRDDEGVKKLLKQMDPPDLSRTFIQTGDRSEAENFAQKTEEWGICPSPPVLFKPQQLWGKEDDLVTVFRFPGYVKRENFMQIDNYLFQRCKNFKMYDQEGALIAFHETEV